MTSQLSGAQKHASSGAAARVLVAMGGDIIELAHMLVTLFFPYVVAHGPDDSSDVPLLPGYRLLPCFNQL